MRQGRSLRLLGGAPPHSQVLHGQGEIAHHVQPIGLYRPVCRLCLGSNNLNSEPTQARRRVCSCGGVLGAGCACCRQVERVAVCRCGWRGRTFACMASCGAGSGLGLGSGSWSWSGSGSRLGLGLGLGSESGSGSWSWSWSQGQGPGPTPTPGQGQGVRSSRPCAAFCTSRGSATGRSLAVHSWDDQVSDAGYRGSWAYLDCATALREEQHLFRVGVGVGIGVRASEVRAALSTPWQSSPPYP